ncbi:MAG: virulence factor [Firmicutes bacterium]|nr:virulence factor [Bacillota bacterium]
MQIVSIEPTPNPNSMKLNMSTALPDGITLSFSRETATAAPAYIQRLLAIDGVKSVYQVADFLALERLPKADWQRVLAGAREALESAEGDEESVVAEPPGKVSVFAQMLRGIPMQLKLITGTQEVRVALPDRFGIAAKQVAMTGDLLKERKWVARGVRYGDVAAIGEEVAAEVAAVYDEVRLEKLLAAALAQGGPGEEAPPAEPLPPSVVAERLGAPDWRVRFAALDQLEPVPEALDVVIQALDDSNPSVRRLAAVYLGDIGGPAVLPHLFRALKDDSAAVRRAAGDCLSDIGDPAATTPMAAALTDPSKLVRWRAARFLYEAGEASAVPALRAALDDPEFEVALQVRMALERIEEGKAGVEPAWKRMLGL